MTPVERVGWFTILGCVIVGIWSWAHSAHGAERPSPLVEHLVREQGSLQSRKDEPVDALELAEAIAAVPRINREWAAMLLTIAAHESALSARIARGECKAFECDHGLAWGLWQGHRNAINAEQWGSPDIGVQALAAARALRGAFYTCNPRGKLREDWALATFRAYAGNGCEQPLRGEEKRMATFNRLRATL